MKDDIHCCKKKNNETSVDKNCIQQNVTLYVSQLGMGFSLNMLLNKKAY